jgi:hypothetical protein
LIRRGNFRFRSNLRRFAGDRRRHCPVQKAIGDGPWSRLYVEEVKRGHPFYFHARSYTLDELEALLTETSFRLEYCVSTLFQPPGQVTELELPREGYDASAGFTVLVGPKDGPIVPSTKS